MLRDEPKRKPQTKEEKQKIVQEFANTYKDQIKGTNPNTGLPFNFRTIVIARSLLGLLNELSENDQLEISAYTSEMLGKLIPPSDPHFDELNEIAPVQFIIIADTTSNRRYIVDLGSYNGTVLLNKNAITHDKDFENSLKIGDKYFDKIQRKIEETAKLDSPDYSRWGAELTQSQWMRRDAKKVSDDTNEIKLQQIDDLFSWSPLPAGKQQIRIHNFIFELNDDLTLTNRNAKKPSTDEVKEVEALPPKPGVEKGLRGKHQGKKDAPASKTGIFANKAPTPMTAEVKKLVSVINELTEKNSKSSEKNPALNKALAQIKEYEKAFGGITELVKQHGYPDSFTCSYGNELMQNPHMDEDNNTYDKSSFDEMVAFATKQKKPLKSPLTGKEYKSLHFTKNVDLDKLIQAYCDAAHINRMEPGIARSIALPTIKKP